MPLPPPVWMAFLPYPWYNYGMAKFQNTKQLEKLIKTSTLLSSKRKTLFLKSLSNIDNSKKKAMYDLLSRGQKLEEKVKKSLKVKVCNDYVETSTKWLKRVEKKVFSCAESSERKKENPEALLKTLEDEDL